MMNRKQLHDFRILVFSGIGISTFWLITNMKAIYNYEDMAIYMGLYLFILFFPIVLGMFIDKDIKEEN